MIYIGKWCGDVCCKSWKWCGDGWQKFCNEWWSCRWCPDYAKLPFSTWSIVFSIFLAIPALVILVYTIADTKYDKYWDHSYIAANIVAFVNYVITIAFVIYAVKRIGEGYYKAYETNNGPHSISGELWGFICYDIFFLIFVFLFIFSFVWDIIILVWANNDNAYWEYEYGGILSATKFMGGWHITIIALGIIIFSILFCLMSLGENSCAKPIFSMIICGYSGIEKERQRRRQKALDAQANKNNQPSQYDNRSQNVILQNNQPINTLNHMQPQMVYGNEEHKIPSNPYSGNHVTYHLQNNYNQPNAVPYPTANQANPPVAIDDHLPVTSKDQNKDSNKNFIGNAKDKLLEYGKSIFGGKKN